MAGPDMSEELADAPKRSVPGSTGRGGFDTSGAKPRCRVFRAGSLLLYSLLFWSAST